MSPEWAAAVAALREARAALHEATGGPTEPAARKRAGWCVANVEGLVRRDAASAPPGFTLLEHNAVQVPDDLWPFGGN